MSYDSYMKNRQKFSAKLQTQLHKTVNPREAFKDARFWAPTVDKAGNGSAVIRFLPARSDEEDAYVTRYYHSFKGPTGLQYYENCRSMVTNKEYDPVSEYIRPFWADTASKEEKRLAGEMKRKVQYYANILVVKDAKNPDAEGKVFLFKFGKKTLDRLNKLSNPPEGSIRGPVDPFDMIDGVNYHLIVNRKDNFPSYDDSEFSPPCPVSDDPKEMARIFDAMYDLRPLVAHDKVKSREDLQVRFAKVMGFSVEELIDKTKTGLTKDAAKSTMKASKGEGKGDVKVETKVDLADEDADVSFDDDTDVNALLEGINK